MKLNEFKAWFDGFTESMEGRPTDKQWKRIKEQVAAIDGTPISYPVYLDRYYPWTYAVAGLRSYSMATGGIGAGAGGGGGTTLLSQNSFDGVSAMYAAGKAEALAA